MMRRIGLGVAVFVVVGIASVPPAQAAMIVFDLNCALGPAANGGACPALPRGATSAGTVTLTDNGNQLLATVQLLGPSQKVQNLWLNYGNTTFENSLFAGSIADVNNQKSGGYAGGKFDLELGTKAGTNPFTFTLGLSGSGNLEPENFLFRDTQSLFYVAVKGKAGGDFYGSTQFTRLTETPTDTTPVPEPATLLLFGTGLAVVARFRRRSLMKSRA